MKIKKYIETRIRPLFPDFKIVQKQEVWWWRVLGVFNKNWIQNYTVLGTTLYCPELINNFEDFDIDSSYGKTLLHEHTHLLQCFYGLNFVTEIPQIRRNWFQRWWYYYLPYAFNQKERVKLEMAAFISMESKIYRDVEYLVYLLESYYFVNLDDLYLKNEFDRLLKLYELTKEEIIQ